MCTLRILAVIIVAAVIVVVSQPVALLAIDLNAAHDNFISQCAKCHGETGRGDGPAGTSLAIKPRNFSDCARMARESDERIFSTIKGGGASVGLSKDMPPWSEAFEDSEIKGLVAYIRQFCNQQRAMNK